MKKLISFICRFIYPRRLKKRGVDYRQLKRLVDCAKYFELNSRGESQVFSDYIFEVFNENFKK